jgi:uncharacterized protein
MSMQGSSVRFELEGERLVALAERALFWPDQSALLLADLHIGKGAAFRASSIPVPTGSSEATFSRLSNLLEETKSEGLFLLGDFWHAKQGRTDRVHSLLAKWRRQHHHVDVVLIEGNHDLRSGVLPRELAIESVPDLVVGPFVMKHHPNEDERGYVLCGHIHPAVRLVGQGRQFATLPAFWFGQKVGVLPSFGEFTGSAIVYPEPGDRVFAICEGTVHEVGLTGAGVS